uniref:Uncharacterized protein n=1 Tax=Brassica oleracea TaxID=3712 RepID=A0A3P6BQA4_BRAOL|nr:unnamed protein product [Brassica oleracea]
MKQFMLHAKEVKCFGQYRPTNMQYKMTISGDTVISKSDLQNNNNFLDLASYEDICNTRIFRNK